MESSGYFEEVFVDCSTSQLDDDSDEEGAYGVQDAVDTLATPDHLNVPPDIFQCGMCPMTYPESEMLTKHMREHANKHRRKKKLRTMERGCDASCRLKCSENISLDDRKKNFEAFDECGNAQAEWEFINSLCKNVAVKQRMRECPDKYRRWTVKYSLKNAQDEMICVCSKMFLDTLAISHQRIKTAMVKRDVTNKETFPDKRGKHNKKSMKGELICGITRKESVLQYLRKFPKVEAEFLLKYSDQIPLEGEYSMTEMYNLYDKANVASRVTSVSLQKFTEYANAFFNLSPETGCRDCYAFRYLQGQARQMKQDTHAEHLFHKSAVVHQTHEDQLTARPKHNIAVVGVAFQNHLFAPNSSDEVFNYRRKLTVFNLTVFDMSGKEALCFMWDETQGRRGANEVSSALIRSVKEMVKQGYDEVHFWSDDDFANKENLIVFATYCWLAKYSGVTITHKFLEKGHTEVYPNNIRAAIEKATEDKTVYIPEQWYPIVESAGSMMQIVEMDLKDFYNCKILEGILLNVKTSYGEVIRWNQVRQVSVSHQNPDILMFRYTFHNEEEYKSISIDWNSMTDSLPVVRKDKWPIPKDKYDDLNSLCNAKVIPSAYHDYYKSLTVKDDISENSEED